MCELSLVAANGGHFLVAVTGLLITVVSSCRARAVGHLGFSSCVYGFSEIRTGFVAMWHMGLS